jgi:hypothetical protein
MPEVGSEKRKMRGTKYGRQRENFPPPHSYFWLLTPGSCFIEEE